MTDNLGTNDFANQSNCSESYSDYLKRAAAACEAGDSVLGMHLYLAAYEKASADPSVPDGMAIAGLREAWQLACKLKERSMAEYVFEKLEPFLSGEEIAKCANELQNLALDRLEEYGFSREELQDMAEMISQDLIEGDGSIVKVESISIPHAHEDNSEDASWAYAQGDPGDMSDLENAANQDETAADEEALALDSAASDEAVEEPAESSESEMPAKLGMGVAPVDDFNPYDYYDELSSVGKSYHAATNDGSGSYVFSLDEDRLAQSQEAAAQESAVQEDAVQEDVVQNDEPSAPVEVVLPPVSATPAVPVVPAPPAPTAEVQEQTDALPAMPQTPEVGAPAFNYQSLAGYDDTIAIMRDFGIGMQRDQGFRNFVGMMNARHGLNRMPALDTLLFRSPVLEDALRFVDATIGEIDLPVLRMSMEEGMQDAPLLCVTVQGNKRPRMNRARNQFEGPGVLVLDELDMWMLPQIPENVEGLAGFVMANISRGAREALNLIRSAVENPDVYVLATATTGAQIDPFFWDLLEPITIVDIDLPTEAQRDDIWREIMRDHPSMRPVKRADLLRFSEGLPRYDLYMATRAALEEAYKAGMAERTFLPVTPANIFDKLAACQPIDSDVYHAIEEEIVNSFRNDLDSLEDLLDGPFA